MKEGPIRIIKKWYFWVIVIIYFLLSIIRDSSKFGPLHFSEYLGMFIGSCIIIFIAGVIITFLFDLIKKRKK